MSDKLIALVRNYPPLYDGSCKDKAKKNEMWEQVAAKMGLESVAIAKAKWRNIRDSYLKYLKTKQSMDENHLIKKYVKWPWAEHMRFINPFLGLSNNNSSSDSAHPSFILMGETTCDEFLDEEDGLVDNEDVLKTCDDTYFTPVSPKKIKIEPNEDSGTSNICGDLRNKTITMNSLDALDLLFLSHAQTIKTFPQRKQIDIKAQIFQIISQAEINLINDKQKTS